MDHMDVPYGDHDLFGWFTELVPLLGVLNGLVCDAEVVLEELIFHACETSLELLACARLLVAVAADVLALVSNAKATLSQLITGDVDSLRGKVGTRSGTHSACCGCFGIRNGCCRSTAGIRNDVVCLVRCC